MSISKLVKLLRENGVLPDVIDEAVSYCNTVHQEQEDDDLDETMIHQESDADTHKEVDTSTISTTIFRSEEVTLIDREMQAPSGRYTILDQLGRGGMGRVYRVYDQTLRRHVAMKTIHPKLIRHSYVLSHFIEEAQVIAQLQHPNIIPIYDFGETKGGGFFYTMIEVKGFRFDQVIKSVHQDYLC